MSIYAQWEKLRHHHLVKLRHGSIHHLSALCLEDLSVNRQQSLDLPFLNTKEEVIASSCGALLYFHDSEGNIFLCNPSTKHYRSLPLYQDSSVFFYGALGYDVNSRNYKILRVGKVCAEVYSLKNDDCWREIPMPPLNCVPLNHHYVYVDAAASSYWLAMNCSTNFVLSFDFSRETFSSFDLPPLPYLGCKIQNVLVKLHDGLLGVVCYWSKPPGCCYELWVWSEVEREWDMMFNVCLCEGVGKPIGLVDCRFLFLYGISDSVEASRLLVYDWTTKVCREVVGVNIYDSLSLSSPLLSYVETTVVLPRGIPIPPLPLSSGLTGYMANEMDGDKQEEFAANGWSVK